MLLDQERCRAWRMCVAGCPYKKTFFNWTTGKSEKCILCFPRIETGQAPACFHSCVGRIRYLGLLLYDADRITEAALVDDDKLVDAQREMICDPRDPSVIEAAKANGITDAQIYWFSSCCSAHSQVDRGRSDQRRPPPARWRSSSTTPDDGAACAGRDGAGLARRPGGGTVVDRRARPRQLAAARPHVGLHAAGVPIASVLTPDVLTRTGLRAALAYLRIATNPGGFDHRDVVEILRRPTRGLPQWFPERLARRATWTVGAIAGSPTRWATRTPRKVLALADDLRLRRRCRPQRARPASSSRSSATTSAWARR